MATSIVQSGDYLLELTGAVDHGNPQAEIWCGEPVQVHIEATGVDVPTLPLTVQLGIPVQVLSPAIGGRLHTGVTTRIVDSSGLHRMPVGTKNGYMLTPGNYVVSRVRDGEVLATRDVEVDSDPVMVFFPSDGPE